MSTLAVKLAERAQRDGSRPAIVTDEGTWSWAELAGQSFRLSSYLRRQGLRKGDRVALICGNRAAYLIAWFAAANVGAIAVTVNVGLVGDGLRYALVQSQSSFLLIEEALHKTLAAEIDQIDQPLIKLRFADEADIATMTQNESEDEIYAGLGSDPITIVYTSGTTGAPKGVLNCHTAYLESGRRLAESLNITMDDRIMVMLPLFHANPQIYAVMTALETGCTIIIRKRFSASRVFDEARQFDATMFTYVGSVLAMIAAKLPDGDRNHRVTRCVGGGCSPEIWHRMQDRFGVTPFELYGMSETAGWASSNSVAHYRFGSCGKVRDDIELMLVDGQDNPVSHGKPGEIVMRPREPFRILLEYWNNPAASQEASRNLWFHSGDLGRFDEDGFLYFLGRSKEIIRKGGENISPTALEELILAFSKVRDVAAVAVPDPILEEEIKVCVVADTPFPIKELRDFLATRVPKYMLPRYLQFVAAIPRTETQKIRRKPLQENQQGIIDAQLA
ncbi:AMP-binding protein [Ferrovibrio sp. MS7]|jgi:crotonobetaine/carnitine-CoA ligase|uniref:class I adenylate-forming enzyme family protein n=1 Tax=Ferrovibrio plantarum TaxID=3119164 RepID=UPI003136D154